MHEVLEIAAGWVRSETTFATATLVAVHGSSPREPGATMIADADGRLFGNVSGGCVESAVLAECEEAIATGEPSIHRYGITDEDDLYSVGLTCGGTIEVLVRPVVPHSRAAGEILRLAEHVNRAEPVSLVLPTRGDLTDSLVVPHGDTRRTPATHCIIRFAPKSRLIIIGAVEYAVSLGRIGGVTGYRVTVVDPRTAFATTERFHGTEVVNEWPHHYLADTRIDDRTAVCVLSHDPRFDVPALKVALTGRAGYVGAMGSRRTHEDRLRRLAEAGVPAEDIARLRSPIGLDLGGSTPDETALSILAEIVTARNGGSGVPLTHRSGPVHTRSGARVCGVVLAAGAGTRFGHAKALARRRSDGTPWLHLVVRELRAAGCSSVVVVLGSEHEEALPLVPVGACAVVADNWADGLSASLRRGMEWVAGSDAAAALVTTVDVPDLPATACARVMANATPDSLARAVYESIPGHPVLIGREHWAKIHQSATGDQGAGPYLRQNHADEIECSDLWHGRDVDEPSRVMLEKQGHTRQSHEIPSPVEMTTPVQAPPLTE